MRRIIVCLLMSVLSACNLGQSDTTVTPIIDGASTESQLVVAWVNAGDLMVWRTGDTLARRIASGGVVQAFVAPDTERVAFTRGAQGRAETLWVVDVAGTAEQQLIGERPNTYTPGENQIGDVLWLDGRTIYFNTLMQQAPYYTPLNDVYRVDVITREIAQIARPSDGGRITISPDGQHVISIYHGTYQRQDGVLRSMDLLGRDDPTNLLFFIGVSTASEFHFYPEIDWANDATVLVAIPDADLIYSDLEGGDTALTTLWQIPIDAPSNRGIIGTVQASFFGLPQWSSDGQHMSYLRRTGDSNLFTAYLADGNGSNERAIFGGTIGEIAPPQWLPNSDSFIYALPTPEGNGSSQYFIASPTIDPMPLSDEAIYRLQFVSANRYVYITDGNGRLDLRTTEIDGESQFIGSLNSIPLFDAVYRE